MHASTAEAPPTLRTDRAEDSAERNRAHSSALIDERLYTHWLTVLSVSSGMVGVCLTAIGLVGIIKSLTKVELFVDDLLAAGAMLFMVTSLLSFFAMRTRLGQKCPGVTPTMDVLFCLGLVVVVVATALLTWVVI